MTTGRGLGFTGEQQFGEADGLVFLRARYYDSEVGRFLKRDPIGYEDSMNLYQYCLNNPILYIDPLGLTKSVASWPIYPWTPMPSNVMPSDYESARACASRIRDEYKKIPNNFIRHCVTSCEISKQCGGGFVAFMAGWANERHDFEWRDVKANKAGRKAAKCKGVSCENSCIIAKPPAKKVACCP